MNYPDAPGHISSPRDSRSHTITQRRPIATVLADIEQHRQTEIAAAKERRDQNRAKREARVAALQQERRAAADARHAERLQQQRETVTNRLERRYRALGKLDEFEANRESIVHKAIDAAAEQATSRQDASIRHRVRKYL